jgi:hypothetical protein
MIERDPRAKPSVGATVGSPDPDLDPATWDGSKRPDEIEKEIARTRAKMSETLDALERRLAPRHLLEKGVDMLKDTIEGKIDTRQIGDVLRDNPIPLALIGAGLGWLLFHNLPATRGMGRHYGRLVYDRAGNVVGEVGDRVSGAAGAVTETVRDWVGGGRSGEPYPTGSEAYARTKSAGADRAGAARTENERHMAGAAGSTAAGPSGSASGGAGGARGAISNVASSAADYAGQAYEVAGGYAGALYDKAGNIVGYAGDYAGKAKDRFVQVLDEYPLAVGALGFLAGAVIAASLPATRTEDELFGATRDDLWREGRDRATEAWEEAQKVAASTAEAAVDATKDAVDEVAEAARNAAGEFVDRVKGEAEKAGSSGSAAPTSVGPQSGPVSGIAAASAGSTGEASYAAGGSGGLGKAASGGAANTDSSTLNQAAGNKPGAGNKT